MFIENGEEDTRQLSRVFRVVYFEYILGIFNGILKYSWHIQFVKHLEKVHWLQGRLQEVGGTYHLVVATRSPFNASLIIFPLACRSFLGLS